MPSREGHLRESLDRQLARLCRTADGLAEAVRGRSGRALMEAAEAEARRLGRTTLVLDTRQGDPSETLYRAMGCQLGGTIPRYARSADGTLHPTAFYYKLI